MLWICLSVQVDALKIKGRISTVYIHIILRNLAESSSQLLFICRIGPYICGLSVIHTFSNGNITAALRVSLWFIRQKHVLQEVFS